MKANKQDMNNNNLDQAKESSLLSNLPELFSNNNFELLDLNEQYKQLKNADITKTSPESEGYYWCINPLTKGIFASPIIPRTNESERLKTVFETELIIAKDSQYDYLTELAARICGCPIAIMSMVKGDKNLMRAKYGFEWECAPKELSICTHAVYGPEPIFVIQDACEDVRFKNHPYVVGYPHVRFYAGIPIRSTEGHILGAFCVIDKKPRILTDEQKTILILLALQAQTDMQLRVASVKAKKNHDLSQKLLYNLLPEPIVESIKHRKSEGDLIVKEHKSATVLFADIVGFTNFSSSVSASQLIKILSDIFSSFDDAAEVQGVTKIKTMGDGAPIECEDHADQMLNFALTLLKILKDYNAKSKNDFKIRIGINSGPLTAGIVGKYKFCYDCFGDTVNIASMMEMSAEPNTIHLTSLTYLLIQKNYCMKSLGVFDQKDKGKSFRGS